MADGEFGNNLKTLISPDSTEASLKLLANLFPPTVILLELQARKNY